MRLIDADEFIHTTKIAFDLFSLRIDNNGGRKILKTVYELIQAGIDESPTIEAEPVKHGHWITNKLNEPTKIFHCSACEGLIQTAHYAYKCYYDYCPNCGAKMDGDEN